MAEQTTLTGRGAEIAIRIGLLVLLVGWCFVIIRPFIGIIGWAVVMSVAMYPTFDRLRTLLGGHTKSAAALMTVVFLLVFIVPAMVLSETLVSGVQMLAANLQNGSLTIPMPSESVRDLARDRRSRGGFVDVGGDESRCVGGAVPRRDRRRRPLARASGASTGLGLLQFVAAVVLSGLLLATAEAHQRHQSARRTARGRANGERFAAARGCDDPQRRARRARRCIDPVDARGTRHFWSSAFPARDCGRSSR